MMEATKRIEFDAAHRVPGHNGACRNLHGHRYAVEATINGDVPADGMVLDFGIVKRLLMANVHDALDHATVLWAEDPILPAIVHAGKIALPDEGFRVVAMVDPPTAENIALWVAGMIVDDLRFAGVTLTRVRVYETPTAYVDWTPA